MAISTRAATLKQEMGAALNKELERRLPVNGLMKLKMASKLGKRAIHLSMNSRN